MLFRWWLQNAPHGFNFFNCPGYRMFILCEIHCFLCPPNNSIKSSNHILTDLLENDNKACWSECNQQEGRCNWCGTRGWCCKLSSIGSGCNGLFGGENNHQCKLKPGTLSCLLSVLFYQTTWSDFFSKSLYYKTRSISEKIDRIVVFQDCHDQSLGSIKRPGLEIWKKSLSNDQHYLFFKF